MQEFIGKKLNPQDSLRARHFVYKVYTKEMNWLPAADNPSNWVVKEDEQGRYFSDIYDTVSVWFGVFAIDDLVAAGRIVEPLHNKLEVELYQEIPDFLKNEQVRRIEINRLMVRQKYNNSPALIVLLQTMYKYIIAITIDFIVTGVPQATVDFAKNIGLKDFEPPLHFFYSKDDSNGATVMYRDCRNKENLKKQINQLNMEVVKAFKFFVEDV